MSAASLCCLAELDVAFPYRVLQDREATIVHRAVSTLAADLFAMLWQVPAMLEWRVSEDDGANWILV